MNTKTIGFIQGMLYPVLMVIITYVIQNLGGSGLVSAGSATIITGVLSLIENALETSTGKALFGMVKPTY